jgi:hypothetical protein
MDALKADKGAAALLPQWRRAKNEEELVQAVAGIRKLAVRAEVTASSSGTPVVGQAGSSIDGAVLDMWLPFVYGRFYHVVSC